VRRGNEFAGVSLSDIILPLPEAKTVFSHSGNIFLQNYHESISNHQGHKEPQKQ
jgi:hypothetical protein